LICAYQNFKECPSLKNCCIDETILSSGQLLIKHYIPLKANNMALKFSHFTLTWITHEIWAYAGKKADL
jgi:uncharacterized membrane protein (DUF2068 family)